jgi:hypothetical protein
VRVGIVRLKGESVLEARRGIVEVSVCAKNRPAQIVIKGRVSRVHRKGFLVVRDGIVEPAQKLKNVTQVNVGRRMGRLYLERLNVVRHGIVALALGLKNVT